MQILRKDFVKKDPKWYKKIPLLYIREGDGMSKCYLDVMDADYFTF